MSFSYCEDFFEGCEKVIDIVFRLKTNFNSNLRSIPRFELDILVNIAKASIISSKSSDVIDSYVLSESSLFIWADRVLLKTCGTTVPLLILERLFQVVTKYVGDFEIDRLYYSRKCYFRPQNQISPHTTYQEEIDYLKKIFPTGDIHIFNQGLDSEWILFLNYNDSFDPSDEKLKLISSQFGFQVMMWNLDEKKSDQFYMSAAKSFDEITQNCKIDELIPGSILDGFVFDPCGYSMNGIKEGCFQTIHVTPQAEFSYASFESNASINTITRIIKNTYTIFKPKKMIISYFIPSEMLDQFNCTICEFDLLHKSMEEVSCRNGFIKYFCYDFC